MKAIPYTGEDNFIFFSYSHRDTDEMLEVAGQLQDHGYNIWFDEGIDPGTEWDENIATHIEQCSFFASYVTGNYLRSQNCRDELNYARDLEKNIVLIYGEDVELPKGMRMRMNQIESVYRKEYPDPKDFYGKIFDAFESEIGKSIAEANTAELSGSENVQGKDAGQISEGKPKSKAPIIAAILVLIVLAVVFMKLGGQKTTDPDTSAASESTDYPYSSAKEIEYYNVSQQGITMMMPYFWHIREGSDFYGKEWDEEYAYEYYDDARMIVEIARSGYEDDEQAQSDFAAGVEQVRDEAKELLLKENGIKDLEDGLIEYDGTECSWMKYQKHESNDFNQMCTVMYIPVNKMGQLTKITFTYRKDENEKIHQDIQEFLLNTIMID